MSFPPKPSQLTFGQLAGGDDAAIEHGLARNLAVEMTPDIAVTNGPKGRIYERQIPAPSQYSDLIDEPAFQHGFETSRQSPVQNRALGRGDYDLHDRAGQRRGRPPLPEFGYRLSGQCMNLERPDEPLRIITVYPAGCREIDAGEPCVQVCGAERVEFGMKPAADAWISSGKVGDADL